MKPIFKLFYLGIVLWRMCLSAQAALSHELITPTSSSPSFEQQMAETMRKMDQDMVAAPLTGDPNHDFSAMMIPHHQGAIDMAKTFLLHGQDAALRRLAQEIIVTQQQEIQVMRLRLVALQSPATTAPHDKRQEISASILVSEKDRVYTGDQTSNTVSVINPVSNKLLALFVSAIQFLARSVHFTEGSCWFMASAFHPITEQSRSSPSVLIRSR